eukprot:4573528-Ditylum_brightwellii.AAC.1
MGKIVLEHIHGGLDLVEPNITQEALLSKEAKDEAGGVRTFSKVLNHCNVDKGKIEVKILWDNGETSWEPFSAMQKDDPVILACYTKEYKLLEQECWK